MEAEVLKCEVVSWFCPTSVRHPCSALFLSISHQHLWTAPSFISLCALKEPMTLKGLSAWNSQISLHSFWHVNPQSFWRHSGHHIPRQSHSDRIIHNGEAISYSSCLLQTCKGRVWARNLTLSPGIARKLSSHGVIFSSSSVFIQLSSMLQKKI